MHKYKYFSPKLICDIREPDAAENHPICTTNGQCPELFTEMPVMIFLNQN